MAIEFTNKFHAGLYSILFSALFLGGVGSAQAAPSRLETVLKKMKSNGSVSVQIVNLTTTRELLSVNADHPVNPASSIKLFTTYAALKRLGINYQFKTEFYKNGESVCVKGGGDPSFVMEDLYLVVQNLKRKGLKNYSGKITLDGTVFDTEYIPEDRTDQDSERAYNAPISGLNFNYNTITVFASPTKKGEPALVSLDWPFPFVKVNGKVMTSTSTDVTWDKKTLDASKDGEEVVTVGGKIAEDADDWHKPFRLKNPVRGFGLAMAKMLADQGVDRTGASNVVEGTCTGEPLLTYSSKPLSYIVQLMNKYSNNFIADSLVKILDHEVNGHSGTSEGGLNFIRDTMKIAGVDATHAGRSLVSGSGLTRANAFSASDFIKLLKHIHKEKLYLPEIFTSLPIAGLDGTLKKKYLHSEVAEKLRGKTGTLNGVQSLVGIYPTPQGEWIGVAVIMNSGNTIPEVELGNYLGSL